MILTSRMPFALAALNNGFGRHCCSVLRGGVQLRLALKPSLQLSLKTVTKLGGNDHFVFSILKVLLCHIRKGSLFWRGITWFGKWLALPCSPTIYGNNPPSSRRSCWFGLLVNWKFPKYGVYPFPQGVILIFAVYTCTRTCTYMHMYMHTSMQTYPSASNKLQCPKCRKVTYLDENGIDALPSNYALKDIIDILPLEDPTTFSPSTPVLPFRSFPGKSLGLDSVVAARPQT